MVTSDGSMYVECIEIVKRESMYDMGIVDEIKQTSKLIKILSNTTEYDTKYPHVIKINAMLRKRINRGDGSETAYFVIKDNILGYIEENLDNYIELWDMTEEDMAKLGMREGGMPLVEDLDGDKYKGKVF